MIIGVDVATGTTQLGTKDQRTSMGFFHPPRVATDLPPQGGFLNKRVEVSFSRDPTKKTYGTVVRHDDDVPKVTIIRLDDGRYILGEECQRYWLINQCNVPNPHDAMPGGFSR